MWHSVVARAQSCGIPHEGFACGIMHLFVWNLGALGETCKFYVM